MLQYRLANGDSCVFAYPVNIYKNLKFLSLSSRQAKRRRLTLDSLASSNADIEVALKNHKKEVILNIHHSPTEEESPPNDSLKVKGKKGETTFFLVFFTQKRQKIAYLS